MTVKPFSRLNYNARNYNVVSAVMVPVYGVTASSSSINEGTAVTYTITTQYVLDGTILYWTTSGTTVAADFSDGVTSGSVTMTNGTATVVRTLLADILTEGAETIVFELRTVSISGTIVASTPSGTVNDTSVLTITPNVSSCNEGASVTWTINAIGFGTGTLYWTNSGTTTGPDFSDGLNSGSITITADSGTLTKTLQLDLSTEGSETIIIQIRTGSTSGTVVGTSNTVTVADTSYSSQSYSVYFNTAASGLSVAHNTALDLSSGDFTIECWYYKNTTSVNGEWVVGKSGNAGNRNHAYGIASSGTNTYSFYLGDSTGASIIQGFSFGTLNLNTWYHLAATKSGSTITLFVNGTQVASAAQTITIVDNGSALTVGNQYTDTSKTVLTTGGSQGQVIGGYVSNLRIIKGTAIYTAGTNFTPPTDQLSAVSGTVLLTCKNASFSDSSSNAFTVNSVGTNIIKMENPFGDYSMWFNGSSQYLTAPANAGFAFGTGDFTVEFWVYMNAFSGSGTAGAFVGLWSGTASTSAWLFTQGNTTNSNLRFGVSDGTTATFYESSSTLALNQWFHVAAVRSSGTLKLYSNGIQVYSGALTQNISVSSQTLQINGVAGATFLSNCYISNLRIVKGAALYPWIPATTALTTTSQNATASQVSLLTAQSATIVDNGNGGLGLATYMTATYGGSFGTSGAASYITTPSIAAYALPGDYTIEFWCYATTFSGGNGNGGLFNIGQYNNGIMIRSDGYSNPVGRFDIYIANSNVVTGTMTNALSLNTWYHVAMVRSGSGTNNTKLYLNGVQITQFTNTTSIPQDIVTIGTAAHNAGNEYWKGYISNVRIVKGTALYTSAFTPSGPLTAVTNTSLLILQSATFIDNSSYAATVTATGSPTIAYFSGGGVAITNTGTVTAGNSVIPFAGTYSYQFNGSSQYLTSTATNISNFGSNNFTFEFWIYCTNVTVNSVIYDGRATSGNGLNFTAVIAQATSGKFNVQTNNTTLYTSTATLVNNTWYHIAVVRSGTGTNQTAVYINGASDGTFTNSTVYVNPFNTIGAASYTAGAAKFPGYISNMRIVNGTALYSSNFVPSTAALTATYTPSYAAQIGLQTAQSSTIRDNSFNNFTITNTGTVTAGNSVVPFAGTYSYSFDGSSQYITIPSNAAFAFGTGDFTIEGWFYPTVNARQDIISFDDTTSNRLSIICISNTLYYYRNGFQIASSAYSLNAWFHFAVVRNSGVTKVYINGVQSGISYTDTYSFPAQPVTIGRDSGGGGTYVTGYLSNIRVVKGTALYTTAFTPTTLPLPIPSGTQLLTCQYPEIMDVSANHLAITNNGSTPAATQNPFGNYYASFNGSSQYLTIPSNPNLEMTGDFTIEGWHYFKAAPGTGTSSYNVLDNSASGGIGYNFATTTAILFASFVADQASFSYTWQTNTWYHVAFVRSGTTVNCYVNGTALTPVTGVSYSWAQNSSITIGKNAGASQNYFNGYISNLRIVKGTAVYTSNFTPPATPLTAITNTALLTCQYADIVDASINSATITNNGSVTTYLTDTFSGIVSGVNYAQKNYSLSLNGSSQYVTSSATTISNFGSSNFTFECWIYCTNVSVNSVIYDGRATSGNGLNLYVTLREVTNGKLSVCTNGSILYTSTATLANNTWYHVAVVRSGTGTNQTAVYINGASDGTFTNSTVYVNPFNTIGAASYTAGAAKFPGYISNLRIVNGTAVYTSAFTPSTTPLKAIANTSLLTAQYNTLFDASVNKFALTRVGNTDMVNVYPFPA